MAIFGVLGGILALYLPKIIKGLENVELFCSTITFLGMRSMVFIPVA